MTATTAPTISVGSYAARRERRKAIAYGVFFLVVAAAILAFFVMNSTPGMESTFKLNPVTKEKIIKVPDLVLPTARHIDRTGSHRSARWVCTRSSGASSTWCWCWA